MRLLLATCSLFLIGAAFKCSPDSILTWASEKRAKQLERECHLESQGERCSTKDDLDKAWQEFADISVEYEKAVKDCRQIAKGGRSIRAVERNRRSSDNDDKEEKTSGDCEGGGCEIDMDDRMKRSHSQGHMDAEEGHERVHRQHEVRHKRECGCKLKMRELREKAAKERQRRIDEESSEEIEKMYEHRHHEHGDERLPSRHQPDDPMDPLIAENPNQKHRRHATNIKHSGHRNRRQEHVDKRPDDETEELPHGDPNHFKRNRRQVCMSKGSDELARLGKKYEQHCERENICLPDEDLPQAEAAKFKKIHGDRAKKYARYIGQVSLCYGKL